MTDTAIDPITLELYRHRFTGVAEEMGLTLRRTSYSPNIKERLDFSCAVFDARGRLVAQAAHIPVHLGAMPASVAAALDASPRWEPGDVVLLNDPYAGGTHLPDITMVSPVFIDLEDPSFFVASRAHHADVGGMSPGSLPLSSEIYQEGLIIPPVKLYRAGQLDEDLLRLILRNVRTPAERRGDLAAQRAAHLVGERRLHELAAAHGPAELLAYAGHLLCYSERLSRVAISAWPAGDYTAEDALEWVRDEQLTLLPIRVTVRIGGGQVLLDFAGTGPAVPGAMNTVLSITQSACWYAVRCLVGDEVPINAGCFAPVQVAAPAGCLLNARPPAAVAAGNVETSQRIVDVVLRALAQALPERIPAASQGTMNNLTIGGKRADGSPYAYYETIAGGMGAAPQGSGLSGVHTHMTNTLNTPIEALERDYPFRVLRYALRRGSGGAGQHRGGDGLVREYEILAPCTVTMLSQRRALPPWGLAGGGAGDVGRNLLLRADGREQELPAQFSRRLEPGDRLRIETPGGGGWGPC
ncbi:MAG: hydantoinase B/oxoprolinase family protein [Chloroflexia bacterium]|nr:hydantoinase B/oxoprolinase family protein [Chloroflexia bacterium]